MFKRCVHLALIIIFVLTEFGIIVYEFTKTWLPYAKLKFTDM